MTADPVAIIKAFQPDPTKFRRQGRGYIDWRFGQVAEYLGYEGALAYVESMKRWHDFERNYSQCLLHTSYQAFLEAQSEK